MRPHRLRVQAFGAFAGQEQVVFDALEGLFLLHGETGAGKTTLLDAIAFALYGRVPGERGTARRLRSDHAAPGLATEVELEVTIGGRRLLITRRPEQERPKRSGAGTTRAPASVRLDEHTAGGAWENKSTRAAEADREIAGLMGMSADQFFQVVLLPQGQFARFLHADAKDKEALLQKLFGTDRFRRVEDWLADRRRATEKEVTAASDAVDRLVAQVAQAAGVPEPDPAGIAEPDSPSAWTARLAVQAATAEDEAAARVAACGRDLDAALTAKAAAEQLADRQRRRRDAVGRKAGLDAAAAGIEQLRGEAAAASRAAEVAPVLDASDRAADAARSARDAEAAARAALPGDAATPPDDAPQALHKASQDYQAQVGHMEALRAVARQAGEEDEAAAAARDRAAGLADQLGQAAAGTERRQAGRPQAEQARDAASQAAAALPAVQAGAGAARRIAADSAALVREHAERSKRREAYLDAREKAQDARDEAQRVREARIDGMRAELAAGLTAGSPCPVCGSQDHPNPVDSAAFPPVSRDAEDAAATLAADAAQAADKAGQQVAAADAVLGDLAERLTAAGFVFPAAPGTPDAAGGARSPLADVLAADPAELAVAARAARTNAEQQEAEEARLSAAAARLTGLQRELDALDQAVAADKARIAELTEQHAAALAEAEAAAGRAAGRRAELRAQLGEAPDLEAALRAAADRAQAFAAAATAADEAARAGDEASAAYQRAVQAALAAGFAGAAGAGETAAGAVAIDAARAAFRDTRWRTDAADRISRHEADAKTVQAQLADPDLDVGLSPPAPVAETTEAARAAQQAHDAANTAYGQARHRAGELAALRPRLDGALAALQPLADRAGQARHLADLAAGLGANQYKMTLSSFVLAARLEEVAQAASERLLTMTAGRYSLVHSDARQGNRRAGLSLLACDAWTGQDRDTATLSGGETFLASLALALGLADVVTAESAGAPMEALFVDEGFGTLDEDTLDEVMNVLDGLRAGGRIVGIVSHVTELRQRIPAQVHVRKSRRGSHVELIPG